MRPIDADALGDKFDLQMYYLRFEVDTEDNPHRISDSTAINWCRNTLNDAPTIDPVKHGRWETFGNPYGVYYCSVCNFAIFTKNTPYCANCGSKMDEEVADNGN